MGSMSVDDDVLSGSWMVLNDELFERLRNRRFCTNCIQLCSSVFRVAIYELDTAPGAIDFAEFGRRLSIILIMFENFEYYIKNCFLVLGSNI